MGYSKVVIGAFIALMLSIYDAQAVCPTFHTLSNGATADASQVMDNYNYILNCPNFLGNVGIGTSSPSFSMHVVTSGFAGVGLDTEGAAGSTGAAISFLRTGLVRFGVNAETGSADDFAINRFDNSGNFIGPTLYIQRSSGNIGIGTSAPAQKLEVNGSIQVDVLASASATNLCINGSVLSSCSSSLRYKENVRDAKFGLREVEAMRPVTFKWKGRDENDFGLVAEEVAKVDPLFATYKNNQIEGVKYPQLTAVLIKAIQEQQSEIDKLFSERTDRASLQATDTEAEIRKLKTALKALNEKANLITQVNGPVSGTSADANLSDERLKKNNTPITGVAESKVVPILMEAVKELKAANDNRIAQIKELQAQVSQLERHSRIRTVSN